MTGQELTAMRKSAGFKAKHLAEVLGINATTLSRYENDHMPIPPMVKYAVSYVCSQSLRADAVGVMHQLMAVLDR